MSAQVEVADQFLTLHKRIWPALLITFGLLAAHSVFISHRIAGPLYQFRRILKAVHDGDLTKRSSIRAHDYLHKEEAVINGMITVLSVRVRDIDEQSWKLRAGLGDLEQAIDGATADTLRERIGSLKARADRLQACVDQFTTDAEEGRAQDHVAGHAATASLRETEPYASGAR